MAEFLPPDSTRAHQYSISNWWQVKLLLQDGSVVDALPTTPAFGAPGYSYSVRYDETTCPVCYLGEAEAGSLETDAVWRIAKIDFTGGAKITYPGGVATFTNRWDQRASLSYS